MANNFNEYKLDTKSARIVIKTSNVAGERATWVTGNTITIDTQPNEVLKSEFFYNAVDNVLQIVDFTGGTRTIYDSDIDLTQIIEQLDENTADISNLESDLDTTNQNVSGNTTSISNLETDKADQSDLDITNTNVSTNTTNINNLQNDKVNISDIVDNLSSTDIDKPLSANQGRVLNDKILTMESSLTPQGNWDADTNTPDISTTTETGYFWIVSVAGTTNIGGITDWEVNDWVVKTSTGWAKIDNTDKVSSVNGRNGDVILDSDDIETTVGSGVTILDELNSLDGNFGNYLPLSGGTLSGVLNANGGVVVNQGNGYTTNLVDNQLLFNRNSANYINASSTGGYLRWRVNGSSDNVMQLGTNGQLSLAEQLNVNDYINQTSNGNTLQIGATNTSYCHFQSSLRPFYFDKKVWGNGGFNVYNSDTTLEKDKLIVGDIGAVGKTTKFKVINMPFTSIASYEKRVIPLILKSTTLDVQENQIQGEIQIYKTGGLVYDSFEVNGSSVYGSSSMTLVSKGQFITHKLVEFDYQGVTWIGIEVGYTANPHHSAQFKGFAKIFDETKEQYQLNVISYYNPQTNTVINSEINDSIVDYIEKFGLEKHYNKTYFDREINVGGGVNSTQFVKDGGTSSEFLKADGSVDSNTYASIGGTSFSGMYPMTVMTNGKIYSNSNIAYNGTSNTLTVPNLAVTNDASVLGDINCDGALNLPNNNQISGMIVNPAGGFYHGTSNTVTGAIKITLPASTSDDEDMISFKVRIFNYISNKTVELLIAGYTYNNVNNWFNATAITTTGDKNTNYTVRFGKNTSDNRRTVIIGETNTVWYYPQVQVHSFCGGYYCNTDKWKEGWEVTFATSITDQTIAYTKTDTLPVANPPANIDVSSVKTTYLEMGGVKIKRDVYTGTWNMQTNSSITVNILSNTYTPWGDIISMSCVMVGDISSASFQGTNKYTNLEAKGGYIDIYDEGGIVNPVTYNRYIRLYRGSDTYWTSTNQYGPVWDNAKYKLVVDTEV